MKKRILIFCMAMAVCLTLTGCGGDTGKVVMSYGDSEITENVFRYYLSYYKNIYLQTYSDMEDTASYYQTVLPDGQTAEEYLFNMTVENVKLTLICMELFDRSGLTVSDAMEEDIDAYLNDLVAEYAGGDKKALNAELAQYGVNIDMLSGIYIDQEKSGFLFDYMFGDNGIRPLTDGEKQTYYEENYSHIYHMYVNDAYYYPMTEEGYTQTDENGNLVTAPLTEEMLAEKNAVIAAIDTSLEAGSEFMDVYNVYSEDRYYANGYYLTRTTDFVEEVVDAAFSLEIGEYTKVKSEYGTHYVLRAALDEAPWASEANADFFDTFEDSLKSELFMEYVSGYLPEVQADMEALSAYSVEASPVNYRF
ncbi:MAG: hypothetical protein IJ480_04195 [Clostridia bacterium]|nr:hypothetical protein [Clostridia bacterium]